MRSDRAISTVMDVAMALLLISASVLVIGVYLDSADDGRDGDRADRTAETLNGMTISVVYDVEDIDRSDHYEEPDTVENYDRTTYGPAIGLLAEAAVVNATIGDERLILYADSFVDSVAVNIESRLVGANHEVYATASWEPYENASIGGNATVGNLPPPNDDTSAVTITPSSGMPEVDDAELAAAYADDESFEDLAEPIARSIVRGYFPVKQSQLALERQDLDRAIKSTHYLRMANLVGQGDELERGEAPLERTDARADDANDELIAGLTDQIADDLESKPIGEEIEAIGDDEDELEALFEERVSPTDVDLTIYTWEP